MKILVTGATGFLGNLVVQHLLNNGHNIIATGTSRIKAESFPWFKKVMFEEFDEADFDPSTNYFNYFSQPEKLIHLAWANLPNYKENFHLEINLPNQKKLLENLIENGLKDITVSGTCLEYGMIEGVLSEEMMVAPIVPYAIAKLHLYKFLSKFEKNVSVKWLRLFYLYGEGQAKSSLYSQLQNAMKNNFAEFRMSGGEQIRDFLQSDEMIEKIVAVALQERVTGIINICSGVPKKVVDFVKDILITNGSSLKLDLGFYEYPDYEPMKFWGNTNKLLTIINSNESN